MTLAELQSAIEELPEDQQTSLATWIAARDRAHWDGQLESDFSPDGQGMGLLHSVKGQVQKGRSLPLSEGKRRR